MCSSKDIKTRAKSAWDTLLEVVFPRTCAGCGRYLAVSGHCYLCDHCAGRIAWIGKRACTRCGAPFDGKTDDPGICGVCRETPPQFDCCKALFRYRGMGARLVHILKYEGGIWLQPQIGEFVMREPGIVEYLDQSTLVPVPLHWWKQHRRGYNQAEVIARAILRVVPDAEMERCLVRSHGTSSQTLLTREQRMENMKDAFSCRKIVNPSRRIVLVDDVLTTGSTLNAAVAALRRAGAGEISAFTLAHG